MEIPVLYTSDFENIKAVSGIYEVTTKEDKIVFYTKIDTVFYEYDRKVEIGCYYVKEGRGILRTAKGIKEYKSLKALYNAVWKLFNFYMGVDYSKVLELKEEIKNGLKEIELKDVNSEMAEESFVVNKNTENNEAKKEVQGTIYTAKQLIMAASGEDNEVNINVANCILKAYNTAKNFYQEDMVKCMQDFISKGVLDLNKYNLEF